MTSHSGSQIIKIHIMPNILQSKGNQKIEFGQVLEIFSSKLMQKIYHRG